MEKTEHSYVVELGGNDVFYSHSIILARSFKEAMEKTYDMAVRAPTIELIVHVSVKLSKNCACCGGNDFERYKF